MRHLSQAIDLMLCGGHQRRSRGPSTLVAPRASIDGGGGAMNEPVSIFAGTWNVNGGDGLTLPLSLTRTLPEPYPNPTRTLPHPTPEPSPTRRHVERQRQGGH